MPLGSGWWTNRDRIKRFGFKMTKSWHEIFIYYLATTVTAQGVDSQGHTVRPWCLFVGQSPVTIMLPVKTLLAATFVTAGLVSDRYFIIFSFYLDYKQNAYKIKVKSLSITGIKPTLYLVYLLSCILHCPYNIILLYTV